MEATVPAADATPARAAATATEALLHLTRQAPPSDPEQLADWLDAGADHVAATLTHLSDLLATLHDAAPHSFHRPQLERCASQLAGAAAAWHRLRSDRSCPGVL